MAEVTCTRCGNTREGLERPPLPGPIGARAKEEICERVLEAVAQAADDADQPLWAEPDGPAGAQFLTRTWKRFCSRRGRRASSGHEQAGHDQLVSTARREPSIHFPRALLFAVGLLAACTSAANPGPARPAPAQDSRPRSTQCESKSDRAWVDCVLAGMTLRDKAAQMVWPQVFGDYVSADAPQWRKISAWSRSSTSAGSSSPWARRSRSRRSSMRCSA